MRKTIKITMSLIMAVSIGLFVSACGGGGGGGGSTSSGGGATALASGSFTKTTPSAAAGSGALLTTNAYMHWQNLYLPGEINAAGKMSGISIQYGAAVASTVTCPNMTIKLSHSNLAALGTTFAANLGTGQGGQTTVVNNSTVTFPAGAAGSWHTISFSTPFDYDGMDNLVVEYERTSACSGTVGDNEYTTAYNASNWSNVSGSATGSTTIWSSNVQFAFAGGDNLALAADRAGNNGNTFAPASTGRAQYLILASDINGSGPITGVQFQALSALTAQASATYTVTLSQVPAATTQLASTTFATNTGSNPTVVANSVTVTLPIGTTKWWVPFSNSFNYDGTSNLLIDVQATVTNGFTIAYQNIATNRILAATTTTATAGSLWTRGLEPTLRFNGGQLIIVPPAASFATGYQILGSGAAGQAQSLYRNDLLGTSGTITNVYVRLDPTSTPTAGSVLNYKLYMGHTAKTTYLITDTYASNMNENALVMSGTLTIPAGLQAGDWVKIPLTSPFAYDSTKNLSILFTADAGPSGNTVSYRFDTNQFPSNTVGRNDNAVTSSGAPLWTYDGIADLKVDLVK